MFPCVLLVSNSLFEPAHEIMVYISHVRKVIRRPKNKLSTIFIYSLFIYFLLFFFLGGGGGYVKMLAT